MNELKWFCIEIYLWIDVAISIPFGGNHDLSNVVHIYRGSKDGLITKPSQVRGEIVNRLGN
jgi:hypothetical protein